MLVLGVLATGALSTETAAVILFVLIAVHAAARSASAVLRVALPITALLLFVAWQGGGYLTPMVQLLGPLAVLLVVLFGIFIMIRGPRRRQ